MSSAQRRRAPGGRSGGGAPVHPLVLKAQAKALETFDFLRATALQHIDKAKARPIEDHGITLLSSFILAIALRWLTMHKGDHLITFALIVNVVLFSVITTIIQGHSTWEQYSGTVVFFSAMRSLSLVHTAPLILAALPLAIDQVKLGIVKTAQKADVKTT